MHAREGRASSFLLYSKALNKNTTYYNFLHFLFIHGVLGFWGFGVLGHIYIS